MEQFHAKLGINDGIILFFYTKESDMEDNYVNSYMKPKHKLVNANIISGPNKKPKWETGPDCENPNYKDLKLQSKYIAELKN